MNNVWIELFLDGGVLNQLIENKINKFRFVEDEKGLVYFYPTGFFKKASPVLVKSKSDKKKLVYHVFFEVLLGYVLPLGMAISINLKFLMLIPIMYILMFYREKRILKNLHSS